MEGTKRSILHSHVPAWEETCLCVYLKDTALWEAASNSQTGLGEEAVTQHHLDNIL